VDELESNRRRHKRKDVMIPSRLLCRAMESCDIEIENISFSGFRARCAPDLEAGSFVSVDLPNVGMVRGRVAWCAAGKIGVAFNRVIDVRRCLEAAREEFVAGRYLAGQASSQGFEPVPAAPAGPRLAHA
jgi:PilZ domain